MPENKKTRGAAYCALILLLVSGLIACMVGAVNGIAAPVIERHRQDDLKEKIDLIFPDNAGFEDISAEFSDRGWLEGAEGVKAVYRVFSGSGGEDGYCVHGSSYGYGGEVEMLTGFTGDGRITGVRVLSADSETPGLGQRIKEEAFLSGFAGLAYDAEGTKLDGVSGATVSSAAAVKSVNGACVAIGNMLGDETEVGGE